MKPLLLLLTLCLPASAQVYWSGQGSLSGPAAASVTPVTTTLVTITDDFNRTNAADLGPNWTADAGVVSISGNTAVAQTTGYARIAQRYTATNLASVNGYVGIDRVNSTTRYPQLMFRMTDASTACYSIEIQSSEDAVKWMYHSTTGANGTEIASASVALVEYGVTGVTFTGTGNDTVVRVWLDATGTPSAVDNWNGDTTPDVTFTTDPGTAVNTGTQVGFGGAQSLAGEMIFNNFKAGNF